MALLVGHVPLQQERGRHAFFANLSANLSHVDYTPFMFSKEALALCCKSPRTRNHRCHECMRTEYRAPKNVGL